MISYSQFCNFFLNEEPPPPLKKKTTYISIWLRKKLDSVLMNGAKSEWWSIFFHCPFPTSNQKSCMKDNNQMYVCIYEHIHTHT